MTEKSYYTPLSAYYLKEAKRIKQTIVWEAKFTHTDRLSFKCLAPHQEDWLLRAETGASFKIPDEGRGQKPFDGTVWYRAKALFVAIYYKPRATEIYEIPIRVFLKEKYESGDKSLTATKAKEISVKSIKLSTRQP